MLNVFLLRGIKMKFVPDPNAPCLVDCIYDLTDNVYCFELMNRNIEYHRMSGWEGDSICFIQGDDTQSFVIHPQTSKEIDLLKNGFILHFQEKEAFYIKFQPLTPPEYKLIYQRNKQTRK